MSRDDQIFARLKHRGILPKSEIVDLVAGEAVRGSWWGHPKSHQIFRALSEFGDHPDVITAKLISGKVTFIHRRLWPAMVAVGSAREVWQTRSLSAAAKALLKKVAAPVRATGKAALELEKALLVFSEQEHTEAGAHAKVLESWRHWAERMSVGEMDLDEAKAQLEEAAGAAGRVPWGEH